MPEPAVEPAPFLKPRGWPQKFRHALRGAKRGIRGQSSFFVHFFAAAAVVAAGGVLHATPAEWLALVLCITIVLTAEMFNTALEILAKAVDDKHNPHLRDALDVGSAAVLVAAIGAAVVGMLIFWRHLVELIPPGGGLAP